MILRIACLLLVLIVLECVVSYPADLRSKSSAKSLAKKNRNRSQHLRPNDLMDYTEAEEAVALAKASKSVPNGRGRKSGAKNKRSRKNKKRNGAIERSARNRPDDISPASSSSSSHLLGLGVFGDMRKFFDELRTDFDTVQLTDDGRYPMAPAGQWTESRPSDEDLPNYQALRTTTENELRRPKTRLRNFVSMTEPVRRKNQYDPGFLWTGLGR